MKQTIAAVFLLVCAAPATAQQFTTASEVRPVLAATQAQWVALRDYEGQDWLYFTQVLSWRCGLSAVHFTINDGAEEELSLEPCHEGTASPNAIRTEDLDQLLRRYPSGHVNAIGLRLTLDDGSEMTGRYQRPQVLMP